jgi:hypothetical protein
MKYAAEMGSSVIIYIPSLIKICSGIRKILGGIHKRTDTHIALRSHKPTFTFSK